MTEHQETPCANCGTCSGGNCGNCGALSLTESEIAVLGRFAQIPFWPVGRRDDGSPLCLEEAGLTSDALSALALKGLIRIDYGIPLSNFDYAAYASCAETGSMALTFAGQSVVELLDVQGAEE